MDQHHQNYESFNDFGFVNTFAAGSAQYNPMNQQPHANDINTKALNELGLPNLMNPAFDPRTMENPSLYDLSTPQYSQMHYHHGMPSTAIPAPSNTASIPDQQLPQKPPEVNYGMPSQNVPTMQSVQEQVPNMEAGPSKMAVPPETVSFDASQNSMMKALGVVRKDVLGANSNKKRKRIVVLNDDSDDGGESNDKSKEINESMEKDDKNASEADNESDQEEAENLTDIGALKAKYLLKNAVMIQGPDKKKKKTRLLDSDDEDQVQSTSIDDIGLVNENENEEEPFENDIIITEPIVPIENPEIPQKEGPNISEIEQSVSVEEKKVEEISKEVEPELQQKLSPPPQKVDEEPSTSKLEEEKPTNDQKEAPKETVDENPKSHDDNEIDPSMSVEAILENIKPMADDDEFFKFDKSSDENDKQPTNDEYFGTPDKSVQAQTYTGKKRGPKPGSKRTPKPRSSEESSRRKRGDRYEDDFVDDSETEGSSDSDYTESSDSSDSSDVQEVTEERRPRGRPPVVKIEKSSHYPGYVTKVPIRKNILKRDRFYDRSRDIPNDVYFGDVKVPLHVLHSRWGSDEESEDDWGRTSSSHKYNSFGSIATTSKPPKHLRPQYTYIHDYNEEPKLSSLKEFIHLCGIKVNYQRLFDGIKSSDHKCALLRRILAQKGMQGEPTVAKCKAIRRELQARRESAELDKSVIITAGVSAGRTRRSVRNSRNATYAESSDEPMYKPSAPKIAPETLQTLSKIRQVIDSDSE